MKLTSYKYRVPFTTPLTTSKTTITHREGLILEYRISESRFYSEAAPLAGFSNETLEDVQQGLEVHSRPILNIFDKENPGNFLFHYGNKNKIPPSLQYALDSLAYQVDNHRRGKPQHQLFNDFTKPVAVNGLISLNEDDAIQQVDNLIKDGFHTIKAKVGTHFENELQQLQQIRARFPDVKLRVDANRGWNFSEAVHHLSRLKEIQLEYCEEPLQAANPHSYEALKQNIDVPLALDETLIKRSDWKEFLPYISHIVMKPMFFGFLSYIMEIKKMVGDVKVVVTTSLESAVGRKVTSLLVASGAGSSNVAHGLHTGRFLANDVMEDNYQFKNGKYYPDSQPLWKNLKRSRLQTLATQIHEYS